MDSSSPLHTKEFDCIKVRDFDKLINELGTGGKESEESGFKSYCEDDTMSDVDFMRDIEESIARIII